MDREKTKMTGMDRSENAGSVLECHLESDLDQLIYSYHPKLHAITSEGLLSNNDLC